MITLALDTSTSITTLALKTTRGIKTWSGDIKQRHTQLIFEGIDFLLNESAISLANLEVVIFGKGPGSFTGIRLSAAVAQALTIASEIKVQGVCSLQIIAASVGLKPREHCFVVCPATQDTFYGRGFFINQTGLPDPLDEPKLAALEQHAFPKNAFTLILPAGMNKTNLDTAKLPASLLSIRDGIIPKADTMFDLVHSTVPAQVDSIQPYYLYPYLRSNL